MYAVMVKGSVGTRGREVLREEICSARGRAGLKHREARDVRMHSAVLVAGILSAERVTADSQAGRVVGPVVEDRCAAGMEPAVAEKYAVAVEPAAAAKCAVAVDSAVEAELPVAEVDFMAAVDSVEEASVADGDKMKDSKKDKVTKELISKTTFLSFPGLTGESRKTLDARLRTSGMTYKDVVCYVTDDHISNLKTV
jgi:hypothetical protein